MKMVKAVKKEGREGPRLEKVPTGISGLDEVTGGGLPKGRPTLVCGGAGSGKTLLGMEFLVRGAELGEPGVFISFEETPRELMENVSSLGFNLQKMQAEGKLAFDHVALDRGEIEETGEYDLEGLFIRIAYAVDSVGAKRIVLDTIEGLFAGLTNEFILRSELRRLLRWLKDKGLTAVITGERGEGTLTRHGLEEYVSDCVILLDHRVVEQVATRRLRVVKYRGTRHGTNEYPFLIDEDGFSVLPVTSVGLDHKASKEYVESGIPELDSMLGGKGYYRGSSILVSGTAGTGKSSIAAHFADATCRRGERCLFLAFEESQNQILRNMRSIGLDLEQWVKKGLLRFESSRPMTLGLEMHLTTVHKVIVRFNPSCVVLDPISDFESAGTFTDAKRMLLRLVDFLKSRQVTSLMTSLLSEDRNFAETGISSIIDTWLLLRNIEQNGERNRGLYVLKSRGMAHSNMVREFLITSQGLRLVDVYVGPEGVLTGSLRVAQQEHEKDMAVARDQVAEKARLRIENRRQAMAARIAAMQAEMEAEAREMELALEDESGLALRALESRVEMAAKMSDKANVGR
jgi:circadian clock protein KaiC